MTNLILIAVIAGVLALVAVGAAVAVFLVLRRGGGSGRMEQARERFQQRREWLEAEFFKRASQSGRPRGLKWTDVAFKDAVTFARDKQTGELTALLGVEIRFAAIEGGDMEDNPNVANVRAGTAVFRFQKGEWTTDGRAVFNLGPAETIEHFGHELEKLEAGGEG